MQKTTTPAGPRHRWTFLRAGGVDQVLIRSGADIAHLEELDQKLWVALACPTRGLHFDNATLDFLDADDDGRIRAPEVVEASRWARSHFRNLDDLCARRSAVPLAWIADDTPGGAALVAEARDVLRRAGKDGADEIGLDEIGERTRTFCALPFNGDGIVPLEAIDDETVKRVAREIMETHGSVQDRSGQPGIDREKLDAFFREVEMLEAWRRKGDTDPKKLPLGRGTLAATAAALAVREKIDDYFTRIRLAAYDPMSVFPLSPASETYRALSGEMLAEQSPGVAALPLAPIAAERPLPLRDGVNPAWKARLDAFRERALEPLIGRAASELTPADWTHVQDVLTPCEQWLRSKPATHLEKLAPERVRELAASDVKASIEALIRQDEVAKETFARIRDLEKLVRYARDLVHFLNNFVSFSEFYSRQGAIFEAGTLYLDRRSCDLTIEVQDAGKHAALAGLAKAYLAYCECTRGKEKMTIVSAFMAGDVDFLLVGRNGVFYDRTGRDWDATITKIIENPISVRAAFFSPYKKFVRMIEEQVAKRAAAADKDAQGKLTTVATNVAKPERPAAPAAPAGAIAAGRQRRIDVGTVAALGVALGSISTVAVGVFSKFIDLGWWVPAALAGIVLAISGPSVVIAWLKLRQRSLGPILDASGWAINGRMRINVPLGASLSRMPKLPADAKRHRPVMFAQSHTGWYLLVLALAIGAAALVAWRLGLV